MDNFQNRSINYNELSKYDKFYRVVCDPLPFMHVPEVFKDIDDLVASIEREGLHLPNGMKL